MNLQFIIPLFLTGNRRLGSHLRQITLVSATDHLCDDALIFIAIRESLCSHMSCAFKDPPGSQKHVRERLDLKRGEPVSTAVAWSGSRHAKGLRTSIPSVSSRG
jgi:hypothetical protein